jgi:hypothetical protein
MVFGVGMGERAHLILSHEWDGFFQNEIEWFRILN